MSHDFIGHILTIEVNLNYFDKLYKILSQYKRYMLN